ncbi:unnamed protein product [Closterium sp. NIES-65]|nr:unnamed protein product [Closterium sp. NIES-65]
MSAPTGLIRSGHAASILPSVVSPASAPAPALCLLSTFLLASLPACPPTCFPARLLPVFPSCLPARLPARSPACLPACSLGRLSARLTACLAASRLVTDRESGKPKGLVTDRESGKPKGYGFCEYRDEETAQSARRNLNGYDINGRQLRVDFAESDKSGQQTGKGGPTTAPGSQGYGSTQQQQQQQQQQQEQQHPGRYPYQHQQQRRSPQPDPSLSQQSYPSPPLESLTQPIGFPAAIEAAFFVAQALGAPPPVVVRKPGTGGMATPGGGDAESADPLTNQLAGMSKQQLYDLLAQMKVLIQTNRSQARAILVENPQLAKGLFQAAPEPAPQPPSAPPSQQAAPEPAPQPPPAPPSQQVRCLASPSLPPKPPPFLPVLSLPSPFHIPFL